MQYQNITNFLDNTANQQTKFRTKNWVEINDDAHGTYDTNSKIKLKTSILKYSLYDYSDAYIIMSITIMVPNAGGAASPNNRKKNIIFKNCAPYTDSISEINNIKVGNVTDFDIVMLIYSLIEYNDNYSKKQRSLWQYYRNGLSLNANDAIANFPADDNNSVSFTFKTKIADRTENDGTKDVKIMAQQKYLTNFRTTYEMPLVNFEINVMLD